MHISHTQVQQQSQHRTNSSALRSSDGDVDSAEEAEVSLDTYVEAVRPKHRRHSGSYVLASASAAAAAAAAGAAAAASGASMGGTVVAGSVLSVGSGGGNGATSAGVMQSANAMATSTSGSNAALANGNDDAPSALAVNGGGGSLSPNGGGSPRVAGAGGGSNTGGSSMAQMYSYMSSFRGSLLMSDASLVPASSETPEPDSSLHGLEFGMEGLHISSLRSAADSSDAAFAAEHAPAVSASQFSQQQQHQQQTPVVVRHRNGSGGVAGGGNGWRSSGRAASSKQRMHPLATSGAALVSGAASSVSSYDGGASSSQSPRTPISPRKFEREEVRRIAHMSLDDIVRLLQRAVHEEEASSRGEDTSPASQ